MLARILLKNRRLLSSSINGMAQQQAPMMQGYNQQRPQFYQQQQSQSNQSSTFPYSKARFDNSEDLEEPKQSASSNTSSSANNTASNSVSMPFPEEVHQKYDIDSFPEASVQPFPDQIAAILGEGVREEEVEIKPDGSVYLPEVKYRKILTRAFGVGGWAMIPRSPHTLSGNVLSREYALVCAGRYVSQARGHAQINGTHQSPANLTESVRSNALMRCCKDLGVASELWDGTFASQWRSQYAQKRSDGRKTFWVKSNSPAPNSPNNTDGVF